MAEPPASGASVEERMRPRERVALLATCALLALPLVLNQDLNGDLRFGAPLVSSGDEPHYLVELHSVVDDHDLDLRNNYDAAHRGGPQAGARYAGEPLDHHVTWYRDGHPLFWWEVFESEARRWRRDGDGAPIPTLRPQVSLRDVPAGPEYPFHPAGLALLLAALLLPLRGTGWLEPAALTVGVAATIAALIAFRAYARRFAVERASATWVACLAFLATPLWYYGRSLFAEPILACCAVLAYALATGRGRLLAAGVAIGVGTMLKPPFAVLALPLAAVAVRERGLGAAALLLAPIALAAAIVLAMNDWMYGAALRAPQPFELGNPLEGALGLLVSPLHGLLPIAPVTAVALAGWPALLRRAGARAWVPAAGFALYFALMASWHDWRGGFCYGPRLLVPAMPFLCLGLVALPECAWWRSRVARGAAIAVAALSASMSGWAAFQHVAAFDAQPFRELLRAL